MFAVYFIYIKKKSLVWRQRHQWTAQQLSVVLKDVTNSTFQRWFRIAWWSQPSYNIMTVSNYRSALWVLLENVMLASMQAWGMASRPWCKMGYFGFYLVTEHSSVEPQYVMVCFWDRRVKQMQKIFYLSEDLNLSTVVNVFIQQSFTLSILIFYAR